MKCMFVLPPHKSYFITKEDIEDRNGSEDQIMSPPTITLSSSSVGGSSRTAETEPQQDQSNAPEPQTKSSDAPPRSPNEAIASKWRQLHGSADWDGLIDPLHPWLRREIIKYGEFAQATYDAFDFDPFSEYCGSCRYNPRKLLKQLRLEHNGYSATRHIYAMSEVELPRWLEQSHLLDPWSKDSNWMGYVAVSDDAESRKIGRRDIVVAWRGTVAAAEWLENMQWTMAPWDGENGDEVKVEHGFLSIYRSKSDATRYNKSSASEQVMEEVKALVRMYKGRGEEVSVTITGHSLGGALALLNAYEAASTLHQDSIPICVVSFGAPRVGNSSFRDELRRLQVKVLRVVNKQDLVPKVPGLIFNEKLQFLKTLVGGWLQESVYVHVGVKLKVDSSRSPYLKGGIDVGGGHNLEMYLHVVDGWEGGESGFRVDGKRDVALVNKSSGMLVEELRIPDRWYQRENKGMRCNSKGRWVKEGRDAEDIPSPLMAIK